jgi:hypothetical protein
MDLWLWLVKIVAKYWLAKTLQEKPLHVAVAKNMCMIICKKESSKKILQRRHTFRCIFENFNIV